MKQYSAFIDDLLSDLENRIDPSVEESLIAEWVDFWTGNSTDDIFSPRRSKISPVRKPWPSVTVNSALENIDNMIIQQYGACSSVIAGSSGSVMNVRCNYGTSILPVLFGAELYIMDEELNTLPTSKPITDIDKIKKIIDDGIPDLDVSIAGKVFDTAEVFLEICGKYPKIGKYASIYHPDTQGPLDVCEVLVGSQLFYMLYDRPDMIKDLLDIVTQTYIAYMKKWFEIVPPEPLFNAHWGMIQKGCIMLRDDSVMNLSPEMYTEFVRLYDQMIFDEFGGGVIHFCGRGDHYIQQMSCMDKLFGITMSQPDLNNMETIYQNTVDKNIRVIGFSKTHAEQAIHKGRDLHKNIHCF